MRDEHDHVWDDALSTREKGVPFWGNTLVRTLAVGSFLMVLISAGLIGYFIRPTETLIVLHYNVYFGVDLLGAWWQAYMFPLLAFLFLTWHFFLAERFYVRSERIASYLLLLSSGMLSSGLLIAVASIALINY